MVVQKAFISAGCAADQCNWPRRGTGDKQPSIDGLLKKIFDAALYPNLLHTNRRVPDRIRYVLIYRHC
jgi:hypothetical protein